MGSPLVAIVIGSESDMPVMNEATKILDRFNVMYKMIVASAHRSPRLVQEFARGAEEEGLEVIIAGAGLFATLFFIKIVSKFFGVYFLARKYIPQGSMYTTLLMSTGLTFGTISSLFGLQAGIISQSPYSILVGVVVASAVIPTIIAQKWFMPVEDEDLLEEE